MTATGIRLPRRETCRDMAGNPGPERLVRSFGRSAVYIPVALAVCGPAVGFHWLLLSYAALSACGLLAGRRLRAGVPGRGLRVLAGIPVGWDARPAMTPVAAWLGVLVVGQFTFHFGATVEAFGTEAVTAGAFMDAWQGAVDGVVSWFNPFFAVAMGSCAATVALAGLIDGIWLGRVSAGAGLPPWKVLPPGRSWRQRRARENARCRAWLLSDAEPRE